MISCFRIYGFNKTKISLMKASFQQAYFELDKNRIYPLTFLCFGFGDIFSAILKAL